MKLNKIKSIFWLLIVFMLHGMYVLGSTGNKYVIQVNGGSEHVYYDNGIAAPETNTLNIAMGDEVTIKVYPATPIASFPVVKGLTGVDIIYWNKTGTTFCTPDIEPGKLKPWLPMMDKIHRKIIHSWPNGTKPTWDPWQTKTDAGNNTYYEYKWVANRRMFAATAGDKYKPEYEFLKYKTFTDGSTSKVQRASKLEGLQMQNLRLWQDKVADNSYTYDNSGTNYYLGIDSDELLYYDHDGVYENDNASDIFKLKQETGGVTDGKEPWQWIPSSEGLNLTYDSNNYPDETHEFNNLMSEYFKYQEHLASGSISNTTYNGYEIQDKSFYQDTDGNVLKREPAQTEAATIAEGAELYWNRFDDFNDIADWEGDEDLSGNGNARHPGLIYLGVGNASIAIPIEATAPFSRDYGLYGNITGQRWPLEGDHVTYTLNNVDKDNLPNSATFKLAIQDRGSDGYYHTTSSSTKSISSFAQGTHGYKASFTLTTGKNTSVVAAYYSRTGQDEDYVLVGVMRTRTHKGPKYFSAPGSDPTPVADNSMVIGNDVDLREGRGDFIRIYQEQWRETPTSEYTEPVSKTFSDNNTKNVYYKKYARTYTLQVGSNVSFSAMDSDDFGWKFHGTKYYLPFSRLAYQMPDNELAKYLKYEVINIDDGSTIVSTSGERHFDGAKYPWDTEGDYELRVTFKGNTLSKSISHLVHVVNYSNREEYSDLSVSAKRTDIKVEELSSDLVTLFGLDNTKTWEVASVGNVLSEYVLKIGPRSNISKPDRLAPYNDYYARYDWKDIDNNSKTNPSAVQTYLDEFNILDYWPAAWSNWLRHYAGSDTDVGDKANAGYVTNTIGSAIFGSNATLYKQMDWQRVLPWIANTKAYGYRVRDEIKPVINIKEYMKYLMTGTTPADKTKSQNPEYLTDAQKNTLEMYYDLLYGRKIVLEEGESFGLTLYNQNPYSSDNGGAGSIYMARYPGEIGSYVSPTQDIVTKEIPNLGNIKRYIWNEWNSGSTSAGAIQTLDVAELQFDDNEYELQIAYQFVDPDTGENVDPSECKEICFYYPYGSNNRFCYPKPGMFDYPSRFAARAGAIMATNGTFFDYYQDCLPGITSYVKGNGHEFSYPTSRTMMGTGAFGFDFTSATPKIGFAQYEMATDWTGYKNSIDNFANGYANVMSGGQISTRGNKYKFVMPADCESIEYPWAAGHEDWPNYSGGEIRDLWCPTLNSDETFNWGTTSLKCADIAENVADDSYKTGSQIDIRRLYGCTKYMRNDYKFERGEKSRLARTFVAKRGNAFHWGVFNRKTNDSNVASNGILLDELSQYSQDMDYDWLMNLDGGGSSMFFVNGTGVITNSAVDIEGPMNQRMAQYALMLVPKKFTDEVRQYQSDNELYIEFDNSALSDSRYTKDQVDRKPVSLLSLTPSLDKINPSDKRGGIFTTSFKVGANSSGAVLFSMSEDGYYHREDYIDKSIDRLQLVRESRSISVLGVGKIPPVLIDTLKNYKFSSDFSSSEKTAYSDILNSKNKNVALYAITVDDREITNVFLEVDKSDDNYYQKYLNGDWNTLSWSLVEEGGQGPVTYKQNISVNGTSIASDDNDNLAVDSDLGTFYNLQYITHAMVGAINIDGHYVTGTKSNVAIDNTVLLVGNTSVANFLTKMKSDHFTTASTNEEVLDAFTGYTDENNNVPDYTWYASDSYLLQMEETKGMHAFAVTNNGDRSKLELSALKLDATTQPYEVLDVNEITQVYLVVGGKNVEGDATLKRPVNLRDNLLNDVYVFSPGTSKFISVRTPKSGDSGLNRYSAISAEQLHGMSVAYPFAKYLNMASNESVGLIMAGRAGVTINDLQKTATTNISNWNGTGTKNLYDAILENVTGALDLGLAPNAIKGIIYVPEEENIQSSTYSAALVNFINDFNADLAGTITNNLNFYLAEVASNCPVNEALQSLAVNDDNIFNVSSQNLALSNNVLSGEHMDEMGKRLADLVINPTSMFAIIGDYGWGHPDNTVNWDVKNLVDGWDPGFILSVGDDNYQGRISDTSKGDYDCFTCSQGGLQSTWSVQANNSIDDNSGKLYHKYQLDPNENNKYNYSESPTGRNRFYPILGNHDYYGNSYGQTVADYDQTYENIWLDYFPTEQYVDQSNANADQDGRYYDFVKGNIHFIALDNNEDWTRADEFVSSNSTTIPVFKLEDYTDAQCASGGQHANTIACKQRNWLKDKVENSTAKYIVVYMHKPPYATTTRASDVVEKARISWSAWSRKPSIVIAGDDHQYERLKGADGLTYVVNGVGGHPGLKVPYTSGQIIAESDMLNNVYEWGAMRALEEGDHLLFEYVAANGEVRDSFQVKPDGSVTSNIPEIVYDWVPVSDGDTYKINTVVENHLPYNYSFSFTKDGTDVTESGIDNLESNTEYTYEVKTTINSGSKAFHRINQVKYFILEAPNITEFEASLYSGEIKWENPGSLPDGTNSDQLGYVLKIDGNEKEIEYQEGGYTQKLPYLSRVQLQLRGINGYNYKRSVIYDDKLPFNHWSWITPVMIVGGPATIYMCFKSATSPTGTVARMINTYNNSPMGCKWRNKYKQNDDLIEDEMEPLKSTVGNTTTLFDPWHNVD